MAYAEYEGRCIGRVQHFLWDLASSSDSWAEFREGNIIADKRTGLPVIQYDWVEGTDVIDWKSFGGFAAMLWPTMDHADLEYRSVVRTTLRNGSRGFWKATNGFWYAERFFEGMDIPMLIALTSHRGISQAFNAAIGNIAHGNGSSNKVSGVYYNGLPVTVFKHMVATLGLDGTLLLLPELRVHRESLVAA